MTDSITLYVHHASDVEIARGEAAARAVFDAANRTPFAAASAFGEAEFADDTGAIDDAGVVFDDDAIRAWLEAFPAAIAACCQGWTTEPLYTNFIVRPEGEPLPIDNHAITAEIDRLMALSDDELRDLWGAYPDSSDMLNSLIYWAADQRGLNSFAISGGPTSPIDASPARP